MAIVILGKTCSGKTTIVNKMCKLGYRKLVTYTSRPIRNKEKQGVDYHFITREEFEKKIRNGFFAEWKSYDTEFGIWYYGTSLKDLEKADDKTVIILTPDGFRDIKYKLNNKLIAIYIYTNNPTIKSRLLRRGDNNKEAERRLNHDNRDFKGIENEADRIFYNNDDRSIDDVVDDIMTWLGGQWVK